MDRSNTAALWKRQALAIGFMLAVFLASMVPRVLLYGSAVLQGSLLRAVLFLVEGSLLVFLTRWQVSAWMKRLVGAMFFLAVCVGMTQLELFLEARTPGSIFPAVLYREPPSFWLTFVATFTECILRIALWTLLYVFPLKLDEAKLNAGEAIELGRVYALVRLRASLVPAQAQKAIVEINDLLEVDPRGARNRIAMFAEQLDQDSITEITSETTFSQEHSAPPSAILTPSLRMLQARQRFVVAVVAIASLFAFGAIARFSEHGADVLPIEMTALLRITLNLAFFVVIAESSSKRGVPVTHTMTTSLLGSIAVGLAVTLMNICLEAAFPGLLFPTSIYTHPTPAIRQIVRSFPTALIDVGFWTLVYLYPLASAEARERAAFAAQLRQKAELARLRAMLAPHFVRNALNVIAALATEDPDDARRLLRGLGILLAELERDEEVHEMAREMAWLRAYAALLEARHPDRLSFHFEADPRTNQVRIPRLLIQPLVENAVLHGVLARDDSGWVRIVIQWIEEGGRDPHMVCLVEDNGPGMGKDFREGGLGMGLVRQRLNVHAPGGKLIVDSSDSGTRVCVKIPVGRKP